MWSECQASGYWDEKENHTSKWSLVEVSSCSVISEKLTGGIVNEEMCYVLG